MTVRVHVNIHAVVTMPMFTDVCLRVCKIGGRDEMCGYCIRVRRVLCLRQSRVRFAPDVDPRIWPCGLLIRCPRHACVCGLPATIQDVDGTTNEQGEECTAVPSRPASRYKGTYTRGNILSTADLGDDLAALTRNALTPTTRPEHQLNERNIPRKSRSVYS